MSIYKKIAVLSVSLLALALLAAGCDLWPQENPVDRGRCDPACGAGFRCYEGACVKDGTDAGLADAPRDTSSTDTLAGDGPKPDKGTTTPDKALADMLQPDMAPPKAPRCGVGWRTDTSATKQTLNGVWALSATNAWAVGAKGTIVRFGGVSWSDQSVQSPTKKNLNAIWASSASDVWVVGEGGTILRYDGSTWQDASPGASVTTADLLTIWGFSKKQIYAGGVKGTLLVYNGTKWAKASPAAMVKSSDVTGLWGTSATNLYARNGELFRSDGKKWIIQSGTASSFYTLAGIWGSGAGNIFEVGGNSKYVSLVYRYSGGKWTSVDVKALVKQPLKGVSGSGKNSVFVVGGAGTVLHFDGAAWYKLDAGTSADLNAVSVTGNHAFAVGSGGVVRHLVGLRASTEGKQSLRGVWGDGVSSVFAVSDKATIQTFDGTSWSSTTHGTQPLYGVWTDGKGAGVAVGPGGYGLSAEFELLHLKKGAWKSVYDQKTMGGWTSVWGSGPRAVHGSSASSVWAVGGAGGGTFITYWDGSKWSSRKTGISGPPVYVNGVWGRNLSDAFAVAITYSKGSAVYRFDGSKWSSMTIPTGGSGLNGVWGFNKSSVYAVGAGGRILSYNGSKWSAMSSGTTADLYRIWGTSASDLWVSGAKGTVLRHDGKTWRRAWSTVGEGLNGVWGGAATDVWLVGDSGRVLRTCD